MPKLDEDDKWEAWSVECTSEHAFQCPNGRHYLTRNSDDAVKAWNTRATPQRKDER